MNDLNDYLLGEFPDDDETRAKWSITGDSEATWALRKLRAAEAELERVAQQAADAIWQATDWKEQASKPLQRDADYFRGQLIAYRQRREEENPNLPKTYKLVGGSISKRQLPAKLDVTDEAAFLAWLEENAPDWVKVEKSPMVGEIKKALAPQDRPEIGTHPLVTAAGELIPGAALVFDERYDAKADQ